MRKRVSVNSLNNEEQKVLRAFRNINTGRKSHVIVSSQLSPSEADKAINGLVEKGYMRIENNGQDGIRSKISLSNTGINAVQNNF